MEWVTNPSLWSIAILSLPCLLVLLRLMKSYGGRRLPPGPPGWPIIGNILDIGALPHRTLNQMRDKYGGVIWLRLGMTNAMAIVSAEAAAEFFKNHDQSFADRNINAAMQVHGYNQSSMALAPYGSYWRVLRRLVTVDMLVTKRLNESAPVRRKCMDDMVAWIEAEAERVKRTRGSASGVGVKVAELIGLTLFNMIGNLMMSRDLTDPGSEVGPRLFEAVDGVTEFGGRGNLADFFPWLRRFDPQGLVRAMDRDMGKALDIVSAFVKSRREERFRGGGSEKRDFLQVMLDFHGTGKEEPARFSDENVNIFILEMFMAGSETNSRTTEWAMTELLRHPDSMAKVKSELNRVVGPDRKLEETDIENLPYLEAVVKETMRLHPVLPLLVPRSAIRDTVFMGYDIPKGTTVFVDVWAIGRDPEAWDDPLTFKPERFLGSKIDYRGQHYQFIPFGAGRRICAGVALAHRLLYLVLGTLLHRFDWELDGSVTPETLNMDDKLGMTASKLNPLLAVPKKCVS